MGLGEMNVHGNTNDKARQAWRTPQDVFEEISSLYGPFDLDAAADAENAKCPDYIDERLDAMREPWIRPGVYHPDRGRIPSEAVWCNPPYRDPAPWIRRAHDQLQKGNCKRVVLLLPAAVETHWFQDFAQNRPVTLIYFGKEEPPPFQRVPHYVDWLVTWRIVFWPKRIQFVPPPGVKKSSNPKPSVLFIGDRREKL
jgi:phage N-6-adenine-methyltransferase